MEYVCIYINNFGPVFRIRKYFARIRIWGSVHFVYSPDLGGQLIIDQSGSGSYIDFLNLFPLKEIYCEIGSEAFNFFNLLLSIYSK
jgi:hypothetical protein